MSRFWKKMQIAAAAVTLVLVAPGARAAYLDPGGWAAALSDAAAEYGGLSLSRFPAYSVTFQDSYGTWTPATQGQPVYVGSQSPVHNPVDYANRAFLGPVLPPSEGQLASTFTCSPSFFPCLGAFRAVFTLPYEIIGFTGNLSLGADFWPAPDVFMPELEIQDIVKGTEWRRPGASFFYGQMFDAPTSSFTVSWTTAAQPSIDAISRFRLSDAMVVRAATVPEPASAALFGIGLLGLGLARWRRGVPPRG